MGNPTRKTDRGSEKIKESVVRPQKPSQIDAAGNIKERQITLAAGEVLGRQPEGVDQTGQRNSGEMDRGQTCLALSVIQCVDHVSPANISQGIDRI